MAKAKINVSEDSRPWVGYVRVSSKDQAETRLSMEHQDRKIKAMAESGDRRLSEIIVDAAESAKTLDRPGAQRLLGLVTAGSIQGIIITKLDRLTRSVRDLGMLVELLEKRNVALVSGAESLDSSTATGRMILNITATIAQWEREIISERTKAALDVKLSRGEHAGNVKYGYRSAGPKGAAIQDEQEQSVISWIRCYRNAGDSLQRVADRLNMAGLRTRSGKPWKLQYVDRILKEKS